MKIPALEMQVAEVRRALILSFLSCLVFTSGSVAAKAEIESSEASMLRTKQVTTPPIRLTQRYKSMQGPKSIKSFQLETAVDNDKIWIKRFKIDVLDGAEREESTEFLCHAWLMADSGRRNRETGVRGTRGGRDPSLFLTISQGSEDLQFPPGFAVEFDGLDISRVGLLTMAVNNNHDEIDREVRFRATIDYLDDSAAQQLGIRPLTAVQLHAYQRVSEVAAAEHQHGAGSPDRSAHAGHSENPGNTEHAGHAGHGTPVKKAARSRTDHWLVPPGRQVLRSDVQKGIIQSDGLIHFIKVHLHPYGESLALVDKTTGREIWKGRAQNHPDRAHLLAVEAYSSSTGIPIYRDREYELITVYENPTDQPIDAMAVMRLFVHPSEAARES